VHGTGTFGQVLGLCDWMRGRACGGSAGRCGHFSVLLVLLLVVILSSSVPGAVGSSNAVGNVGPRKADVPGIQCQVCHRLAEHLYASRPDGAKTTEDQVIEFVEKSTTAWRPEGAWITRLHVAANEPRGVWAWYFTRLLRLLRLSPSPSPSPSSPPASLVLVDMGRPGQCTLACRTIEYAAQKVMGEHDADVGEALYVGRYGSVAAFRAWFCGGLTGSCDAGATEGAAEGGVAGATAEMYGVFVAREDGDQDVERILGEMADQGLRGKMYTREEAMEKYLGDVGDAEL
jgi:hypothetical protein